MNDKVYFYFMVFSSSQLNILETIVYDTQCIMFYSEIRAREGLVFLWSFLMLRPGQCC